MTGLLLRLHRRSMQATLLIVCTVLLASLGDPMRHGRDVAVAAPGDPASMTVARYALVVAAAANGKLDVVGGSMPVGGGEATNAVEEYDPSASTWTSRPGMSLARAQLAVAASGTKVYAVGGYGSGAGDTSL